MSSSETVEPPPYDGLLADLLLLRRQGIVELRDLALPALAAAVRASAGAYLDRLVDAPAMEALLRCAVDELEDGRWGRTASILFGLAPGTRGDEPSDLREEAAAEFGVGRSRWRNHWERLVIGQVAELLQGACHKHQMRLTHLALERRAPASSRLAVAWVERFEAYYGIWSPVHGLGADLTAYRATLLDPDRPYDWEPSEQYPEGYSQEEQAAGYATDALFHFAAHLVAVESFVIRHGGLWLLSDQQAETEVADAVARIRLASPMNEEDDSFLRLVHAEAKGELHPFRNRCRGDEVMAELHHDWQAFVATCACQWEGDDVGRGYFPTHRLHPGIEVGCQVHAIITAANDYCRLVDDDWDRIADWYHLQKRRPLRVNEGELYSQLRDDSVAKGVEVWPPWG